MGIQLNGTSGTDVISAVDGSLTVEGLTISGDFNIADKIIHSGDTNTSIRFPTADTVSVETAGSERFRITSAGKVGIGTNDPLGTLSLIADDQQAHADIVFQTKGGTSLAHAALSTTDDTGGTDVMLGSNLYLSTNGTQTRYNTGRSGSAVQFGYSGTIRFYNNSGNNAPTERLRIGSNGSVGIGTDNLHNNAGVYNKLTVDGDTTSQIGVAKIVRRHTNSSSGTYTLEVDSSSQVSNVTSSGAMGVTVNNGRAFTINGLGNVSIATDLPRSRLDVFETVTGTQTAIRIGNTNTPSSANDKRLEFVDGTGTTEGTNKFTYGYIQGYRQSGSNNGGLIFGTKPDNASAPSEKLRIDANGRIQRGSDPSNLGQALVNIVTGGEDGISLGRNQGANVSSGDVLGTLAFQSAIGSQTTNSAEASIKAIAEENSTGSTAATGLYFYTKQSGTGPGSSPAEAFHINAQGMTCHTSTPSAKVYAFSYPLGTGGSTTTTTIATLTSPQNNCLAVATINWSSSYGASGSTRSSGQFVCGVRRSQNGTAWSASTSELGPAGDGSYSIDCVWNGQTLQVTRGAWLNFIIDVRICVYNATITNNLI